MELVFSKKLSFGFFDSDRNKRIKMSAILKHIANIGGEQLMEYGYSHQWLLDNNLVFLLIRNHINIIKTINFDESIIIETWAKKLNGATFIRDCNILNNKGELLVSATTAWLLVNPSTRQVLRPNSFPNYEDIIEKTGKKATVKDYKKIDYNIENMEKRAERIVVFSDIDSNNHLYNAVYANIIWDYLFEDIRDKDIYDFKITYKNEAILDDSINIYYLQESDKVICVGMLKDKICFESELSYK